MLSTLTTVFLYTVLLVGLQRLFALSKDLEEIRDLLRESKRERDNAAFGMAHAAHDGVPVDPPRNPTPAD